MKGPDVLDDPRTSLAATAREAGLPPERFRPVDHTRWKGLLDAILERFTHRGPAGANQLWLWEDFQGEQVSLRSRHPDGALDLLRQVLPADQPVWFVAEDWSRSKRHGHYWLFESDTDAVVRVLAEHASLEYYVVGRRLDWLVAENHHDVVIALGEPVAARLASLRDARGRT